ncbi:MAG: hypothetical protein K6F64_05995 [Clostridia bacterium]|nr:hypothetical protein [Clostridia bacterium]
MADGNGAKIKNALHNVKTYWKTPPEGKHVSYREYVDITLGIGANYAGFSAISKYISFAAGCYLMMYHYKLPYLAFSVINIINMPLGYIWTMIAWIVNDNLGFLRKKTERKIYMTYFIMMIVGLFMIIFDFSRMLNPSNTFVHYLNSLDGINAASAIKILGTNIFYNGYTGARNIFWRKKLIPKYGRYKYSLYCDFAPKTIMVFLIGWLPFYNIGDVTRRVWVANLLFAIYNAYGFNNQLELCASNISPDPKERIMVRTFPIKISHLAWNIVDILIPVFIGFTKDEWADIAVFKYILPITFLVFASVTLVLAGRIKERIPQPPLEKKVNISFWDGMTGVMYNKYKWINTVVGLLDSLGNGMLAFTTILYLYTFRMTGLIYSLIVTLVSFAGTPPDFFTPYFRKRFSYKQIMIFYQLIRVVCYSAIVACYLLFGDNLTLCGIVSVVVLIFMEMCTTVPKSITRDMDIQITDYQMYLSGERLESFSGVFGWFTGPITSFVSLIIPLLLLKYGFNSNWDILFIDESRIKIIVIPIILDIIGYLLMTIPYFFWDYDDSKQNKVIQVLRRREEVTSAQELAEKGELFDTEVKENVEE